MLFQEGIRKPAVAGQFYKREPSLLMSDIKNMMDNSTLKPEKRKDGKKLRAVILPHAGYMFSGQTAVDTVLQAKGSTYKRIIVIAPSHRVPFEGAAVAGYSAYSTPLGDVPQDEECVKKLMSSFSSLLVELPDAHKYEHALEVELPILQMVFGDFKLVPLVCGSVNIEQADEIAEALCDCWQEDTLWVISSDFTHYGVSFGYVPFRDNAKANLRKLDMGAVDKILSLDLEGFDSYLNMTGATICGAAPVKILLSVIAKVCSKGKKVLPELVKYTTSGELTGDWGHCVSYAGIAFYE